LLLRSKSVIQVCELVEIATVRDRPSPRSLRRRLSDADLAQPEGRALADVARHPGRVSSMSLWHGDFELGPDCPKTSHQRDLKALMLLGAEGRQRASALHDVMCHSISVDLPPNLSYLALYSYATVDLLHLYCRLNASIMSTDVGGLLRLIEQPTLVVTSEDDDTAHPAGSKRVAAELPDSTLYVAPHGDHISLFNAEAELVRLASEFLSAS
jgi:pimeloyl-ACP methyl ester carboxylesterase